MLVVFRCGDTGRDPWERHPISHCSAGSQGVRKLYEASVLPPKLKKWKEVAVVGGRGHTVFQVLSIHFNYLNLSTR